MASATTERAQVVLAIRVEHSLAVISPGVLGIEFNQHGLSAGARRMFHHPRISAVAVGLRVQPVRGYVRCLPISIHIKLRNLTIRSSGCRFVASS